MDLGADMMGNHPHDALTFGGCQSLLRLDQTARKPIDPEPTIWIEHHFDDGRVFEPARDRRPERGAQHARAPGNDLCLEGMDRHRHPDLQRCNSGRRTGRLKEGAIRSAQQLPTDRSA